MAAPVKVHPIGHAFDAVFAQAAVAMAARPKTNAGVEHEISERVVLCRPAG
jgi:hypothetical protein